MNDAHIFALFLMLAPAMLLGAQTTNETVATASAFVCVGSTNYQNGADLTGLNFGGAGTLAVAPASSAKGEFQSLLRFDLHDCTDQFNQLYGPDEWTVTGLALELAGNYGTAGEQPNNPLFNAVHGGQFVIEWLADNAWLPGSGTPNQPTTDGVSYATLPELLAEPHSPLVTNLFVPPGDNVPVRWTLPTTDSLVAATRNGESISLRMYAADNAIGYLFNSTRYGHGNAPQLVIVAAPVLRIVRGTFLGHGFTLEGWGNRLTNYHVQRTPNLLASSWTNLATITADASGWLTFVDSSAGMTGQAFYRFAP